MSTPKVTVILPVYNAAAFLGDAIDSIFSQTFSDFEIIAIDDGSTDGSAEILRHAAKIESRLCFITRENHGLVFTLNEAIALARGELLARMDADDVCLPTRLSKQVEFLDSHGEIAVAGTWIETFGGEARVWNHPADSDAVQCAMVVRCPLAHPSVMMRRALFYRDGFSYDLAARHVEDYALWMAVSARHRLANIPEVLVRCRLHDSQVSAVHADYQQQAASALQIGLIADRLRIAASPEEAVMHRALAFSVFQRTAAFLAAASGWLYKLSAANEVQRGFPREAFMRTLTGRFVMLAKFAKSSELQFPDADSSPFAPFIAPNALREIR